MKTILILGDEVRDESIQMVTKHLQNTGAPFSVLDTKRFPAEVDLTVLLDNERVEGVIRFRNESISIKDIGAVWNRRICQPLINPAISNSDLASWTQQECYYVMESFLTLLPQHLWMNPVLPEEKVRYNKLFQMETAKRIGLKVPASIVSNSPEDAMRFCGTEKDVIVKALRTGFFGGAEGSQAILYTSPVPEETASRDIEKVRYCPVFFQENVEKDVDVRITVIGTNVFACAINSQLDKSTLVDWRKQMFLKEFLPHMPHVLPDEVVTKVTLLVQQLGLRFGAVDMALTKDGEYVFFEINHNGQWGWIEILTGLPIAKAIADHLIQLAGDEQA